MALDVGQHRKLGGLPEIRERALAALPSGVVIIDGRDPARPIIDVNAGFERLTGFAAAELIGQSLPQAVGGPAADPVALRPLKEAVQVGAETTVTLLATRKDGRLLWVELRLVPERDDAGRLLHLFGQMRDVNAKMQAIARAQETDDRLRLLFASHPQPMWMFDLETLHFLDANEAAITFYGYSRDEFQEMTLLDVRPPEDAAAILAKVRLTQAAPGGIDAAGIWRHRKKDGTVVDVEVTTHALAMGGKPVRLSIMTDVTEREEAEAARRASENRLQAILDNTSAIVYLKDLDGRYRSVNRQFTRHFRISQTDIIGKTDDDLFAPPIAATRQANDRLVIDTGTAIEVEEVLPGPNGNRTYLTSEFPLRNSQGAIDACCGFATDITERKQAEEAQRFAADASALLAASLDDTETIEAVTSLTVPRFADCCIVDVVDDGRLQTLKIAHVDPDRQAEMEVLHARYSNTLENAGAIGRVIQTGRPVLHENLDEAMLRQAAEDEAHLASMHRLQMRSSIIAPMTARGRVLGALTLVTAESGRRFGPTDLALACDLAHRCGLAIDNARLYAEAQAAVRARDQFLSIAAHELRTPVSGIKGYSQMLLRAYDHHTLRQDRLSHALQTINLASDRLAVLTNDLLDVSRIRLGQLPLRMRTVDLAQLVKEVPGWVAERYPARPPLVVTLPDMPCEVQADPDRLEQILVNLLDNAVKYSPEGSPITVSLTPDGVGYLLTVRDEGIGLPPDSLETIFEPFGRAANATAQNLPGLGLGLYICHSIAERHGGRIWADSAGDDAGTTMRLWLPIDGSATPAAAD